MTLTILLKPCRRVTSNLDYLLALSTKRGKLSPSRNGHFFVQKSALFVQFFDIFTIFSKMALTILLKPSRLIENHKCYLLRLSAKLGKLLAPRNCHFSSKKSTFCAIFDITIFSKMTLTILLKPCRLIENHKCYLLRLSAKLGKLLASRNCHFFLQRRALLYSFWQFYDFLKNNPHDPPETLQAYRKQ